MSTINIRRCATARAMRCCWRSVFLERISRQQGKKGYRFSPDAMAAIENYGWPGNVRELENRVKRAVIMAETSRSRPATWNLAAAAR